MSNTFFMMMAAAKIRPPYQKRIAYLECTGTQYIDTGLTDYVQTHLYRLVNTVAFTDTAQSQTGANGTLQVTYQFGRFGISAAQLSYVIAVNEVFTYEEYGNDQNTTTLTVNGVTSTRNWGSNYGGSILLGALLDSNLGMHYAFMRCCGLKIYSNSTGALVRDLVPVIDWSDRPAMFDQVSGQLFYNQGTGEFEVPPGTFPVDGQYGVFLSSGGVAVSSAMSMSYAGPIRNGSVNQAHVYSGGVLSGPSVGYWGNVYVSSGGTLSAATLYQDGGNISVGAGGSALNTVISSGRLTVFDQGLASAVVMSGGSLVVSSGASALAVTSNAGAVVDVHSGGYIEYTP